MLRVLLVLAVVALVVYALVEIAQADARRVRFMPVWLWAATVLLVPLLGALAWFGFGRPTPEGTSTARRRPIAPDDDPEFLGGL